MTGKYLVDTNILVYAYDRSEPAKQKTASVVLDSLARSGAGVLSPQILAEFFSVVTRKIVLPLSAAEGYERINNYLRSWDIVDLTGAVVLEAARGVRDHRMALWDALIWSSAKMNQLPAILSEDFSHNSMIEGVRFINPFTPGWRER